MEELNTNLSVLEGVQVQGYGPCSSLFVESADSWSNIGVIIT